MGILKTVVLTASLIAATARGEEEQIPLSNDLSDYECAHPAYKVHLFSSSPLVIYIENFITPDERVHLRQLAQGQFKHSYVQGADGEAYINSVRTSQSTSVTRDAVVRCIESRALAFQGNSVPESHLEPIQLVKYTSGEHFHFHTDWFTDPLHATTSQGGNRASSFFGYVLAENVTGGGTNFPILDAPGEGQGQEEWCRFVDCDEEWERGVTFRPIEGNVVYWENVVGGGRGKGLEGGDERVLHAGLPVVSGEKIGMNIWTREAPLDKEVRGE